MLKKIIAMMLCLTFFVSGCGTINPIGPIFSIGVAWMDGEASKYYNSNYCDVAEALREALKELDLPITKNYQKGDIIYFRVDAGDRFKIKVERVRENITNLKIRVNIMGDKPYAELIFKKIDEHSKIKVFYSEKQLKKVLYER